jgi:hypothetical protein
MGRGSFEEKDTLQDLRCMQNQAKAKKVILLDCRMYDHEYGIPYYFQRSNSSALRIFQKNAKK